MTIREICYELFDAGLTADEVVARHPEIRRRTILQYYTSFVRKDPLPSRPYYACRRDDVYAAIKRLGGDPLEITIAGLARESGVSDLTARKYFDEYFHQEEPRTEPKPKEYVRPSVRVRCGSGAVFDWDTPTDTIWR